jgi:hypothetical protein
MDWMELVVAVTAEEEQKRVIVRLLAKETAGQIGNEMQQNKTTTAEEDMPRLSARSHIVLIPFPLAWLVRKKRQNPHHATVTPQDVVVLV